MGEGGGECSRQKEQPVQRACNKMELSAYEGREKRPVWMKKRKGKEIGYKMKPDI